MLQITSTLTMKNHFAGIFSVICLSSLTSKTSDDMKSIAVAYNTITDNLRCFQTRVGGLKTGARLQRE